jgi:hypothetical protein
VNKSGNGDIVQRTSSKAADAFVLWFCMRNRSEVEAVRRGRLVDLLLWIDRDVPTDPTQEYGSELCDVIVQNRGTLKEFCGRLAALARWAGLISECAIY